MNKLDINAEHSECEAYKKGYNQALDDFVENITLPIATEAQITEIVELLKIGKENEHDYNRR